MLAGNEDEKICLQKSIRDALVLKREDVKREGVKRENVRNFPPLAGGLRGAMRREMG